MFALLARFNALPISRKLPLAICGLAAAAAAGAGGVAALSAASGFKEGAHERLQAGLSAAESELQAYFGSITEDLKIIGQSPETASALAAFSSGYGEFGAEAPGALQRLYIEQNPNPVGEKDKLNTAADGSAYSQAHARFHPWFHTLQQTRGYYDVFLFNMRGDLVYTVFKEPDFATNVVNGPWKESGLGQVYRAARAAGADGGFQFVDFAPYAPSNDVPASFIAGPITDASGRMVGVVAFQMPIARINAILQNVSGLGETGEATLIGADGLVRNDSRFTEDSVILKRTIDHAGVEAAQKGASGTLNAETPLGKKAIIAYEPFKVGDAGMTLTAEITEDEAYENLRAMLLQVALLAVLLTAAGAGAGLMFARSVAGPIARMTEAMRKLAAGETHQPTPDQGRADEIGAMAAAVEVFRANAIERVRLEAAAETQRRKDAARAARIEEISSGFERACAEALNTLGAASTELEATATAMTSAATLTSTRISGVAAAAEESTANSQTAASAATELAASVDSVEAVAGRTDEAVALAAARAADAAKVVRTLNESAGRIGAAVDLIRDVADQTNLLALNATIEAARAGEAGRGFAVVASEVKALAGQTGRATEEIAAQIAAVQAAVQGAVDAISAIDQVMAGLRGSSQDIARTVGEQSAATSEIARAINEVSAASHNIAADIGQVAQTAGETGAAATQVLSASQDLARQSEQLQAQVRSFLADLKAA